MINDLKLLTILLQNSIIDVWLGSEMPLRDAILRKLFSEISGDMQKCIVPYIAKEFYY